MKINLIIILKAWKSSIKVLAYGLSLFDRASLDKSLKVKRGQEKENVLLEQENFQFSGN